MAGEATVGSILCSIPGCTRKRSCRGWCNTHYERWRIHGSTDLPPKAERPRRPDCSVDGCPDESQPSHGMCRRHYSAEWYQANKDRMAARVTERRAAETVERRESRRQGARDYYQAHRVRQLAAEAERYRKDPEYRERKKRNAREWSEQNRTHVLETKRRYYRQNRDRIAPKHAAYYAANRDARRAAMREWVKANPEKVRELAARARMARRAREYGGRVTRVDRREIIAEHGMVCHLCGGRIQSMRDLHLDHVVPLARGGEHTPENVRPAHARCNWAKGASLPEEREARWSA